MLMIGLGYSAQSNILALRFCDASTVYLTSNALANWKECSEECGDRASSDMRRADVTSQVHSLTC